MAHCIHHRAQLSPQLRWGQNALGIPLGNVFKIVQNHCPALRSEGGEVRNSPVHTKVREGGGGGGAPGAEADSRAAHGGDHDHADSPAASGGTHVRQREKGEAGVTGISCYKLDTNLTSHLPALLSGGKQNSWE